MKSVIDLFFNKNYGKLYEKLEKGKCEVFEFEHFLGSIRHLFIKREIPIFHRNECYYDIVTPYGYGGPVIVQCENGKEKELVEAFEEEFRKYCEEQKIISEFIRFHPVLGNAANFSSSYDVTYLRDTVGTNLRDFDDPVANEFSKSTRKNIRKALRTGVEYRVTENPSSLEKFREIYCTTMNRIHADDFYFFDDEYFSDCLKYFGRNIVLVEAVYEGKTIGMELHFRFNNFLHTHLSGTLEEFHHLSPVYVMTYGAACWGKENGIELIHAGGGVTNNPEDTLYLFKKKFGQNTSFQFHIGRKIWDERIYTELCGAAGVVAGEEEFFPAYRSKAAREVSEV